MKKIALFLSLNLLVYGMATAHAGVPKVGKKCSTLGFEQTHQDQMYVCKKVGKKLKWQKAALPPISIDNLDLRQVPALAYQKVIKELESRSRSSFNPTVIASPLVKPERIREEVGGLERAIDFFSPYFLPDKFQVVYLTGKDLDWIKSKSDELGLARMLPQGDDWEAFIKRTNPCAMAMAGKGNGIPTFVQCLDNPYTDGYRQTCPHEYTHLFQKLDRELQNVWYIEGSASYFGWTLGFYPYDPSSRVRSEWVRALFYQLKQGSIEAEQNFKSKNLTQFKEQMAKISNVRNSPQTASIAYWIGGLATEVLIALYGMDKFFVFAEQMRVGQDVNSSMQQTFGISADTFYEKLAPYAWAQMD